MVSIKRLGFPLAAIVLTGVYGAYNIEFNQRSDRVPLHSLVRPIRWTEELSIRWPKQVLEMLSVGEFPLVSEFVWLKILMDPNRIRKSWSEANIRSDIKLITSWNSEGQRTYQVGAYLLTVLRDDHAGAIETLERANTRLIELSQSASRDWMQKHWPRSWEIPFLQGYLFLFEEPDLERAAMFFEKASNHPAAPQYLAGLSKSLKDPRKKWEVQVRVLETLLATQGENQKLKQALDTARTKLAQEKSKSS